MINGFNKTIFILGHMRSRSSLLAHILMNQKTIYGLGESNKKYVNRLDLVKMRVKTRLKHKLINPLPFTFLDQINHNSKTPNIDLIKQNAKIILLGREPEATFLSIQKLTQQYYEEWSHQRIEDYYLSRMHYLKGLRSQLNPDHVYTIDSDDVVSNASQTLSDLSHFLQLKQSLSGNYKTYSFSGLSGDPSSNIQQGRITSTPVLKMRYSANISKQCFSIYQQLVNDAK